MPPFGRHFYLSFIVEIDRLYQTRYADAEA